MNNSIQQHSDSLMMIVSRPDWLINACKSKTFFWQIIQIAVYLSHWDAVMERGIQSATHPSMLAAFGGGGKKERKAKVNRKGQMSSVTAQQALPPSSTVWPFFCWWLKRVLNIPWYQSQSLLSGCYFLRQFLSYANRCWVGIGFAPVISTSI